MSDPAVQPHAAPVQGMQEEAKPPPCAPGSPSFPHQGLAASLRNTELGTGGRVLGSPLGPPNRPRDPATPRSLLPGGEPVPPSPRDAPWGRHDRCCRPRALHPGLSVQLWSGAWGSVRSRQGWAPLLCLCAGRPSRAQRLPACILDVKTSSLGYFASQGF